MSIWLELLLLAFASMFWPTLIAIVVTALRLEKPMRILAWFLAGGLLTTITVGMVVVLALQSYTDVTAAHDSSYPVVSIVVGALSLVAAFLLRRRKPKPHTDDAKPSRAERAVAHGRLVAFAGGVVLNIVPGTFPIVALKDIAQLGLSNAATAATIAAFYVIMFAFVEIPLIGYLFAPSRTQAAVSRFNAWLGANVLLLAIWALVAAGVYLIVRGAVSALF